MVTIATQSLSSCRACELSFLRIGENLLDILPELTFLEAPTRLKDYSTAPRATVGLVMGNVRTPQDAFKVRTMRDRVDILLAIGTCATAGGLPALANAPHLDLPAELAQRHCTVAGPPPDPADALNKQCIPVSSYVHVDLNVSGCPPHPDWLEECLLALVDARTPRLPTRCLCDACPTRRTGTRSFNDVISRMLEQPDSPPRDQLADMVCLLEQGFVCMGPVTRAGCGGKSGPPRCIASREPCRGCHGLLNRQAQPLADYVAALAAAGFNPATMPDKQGFLSRYTGFGMLDLYRRVSHE